MNCQNCGGQLPEGANNCPYCGAPVNGGANVQGTNNMSQNSSGPLCQVFKRENLL